MAELVRERSSLDERDLDWLHRLVGEWQLLADLSFADLLLLVPQTGTDAFVVVAQLRPTTAPTAYQEDRVGQVLAAVQRRQFATALTEGRICRESDPAWGSGVPIREEAIPVRHRGRVIAVVARDTNLSTERTPSRLDIAYLQSATDLARMVAEGEFPYPGGGPPDDAAPRVGDGLIRLDAGGSVVFASPNAVSAYRRLGFTADLVGRDLAAVTADVVRGSELMPGAADLAAGRRAGAADAETPGATIQLRSLPLRHSGRHIGALVLVHDVTELRRRDRALLSKDATIREIHHRVKNNLQTVAALLRLQARRLAVPEARSALEESVRRVSSIALVHETLSLTLDESVDFDAILDRILALVGEVSQDPAPGSRVRTAREGSFGALPASVATPLAMVLTELIQNGVEHGARPGGGEVTVAASRRGPVLAVTVEDDGPGLPAGFSLESAPGLGLQIVRTLVQGELGGSLQLLARPGGGTRALVELPEPPGGPVSGQP